MLSKAKWLLPLLAFAPLLMAPSGGYPSFPTFQAVTITPQTGNFGQVITPAATSQIPGIEISNSAASRKLEMLYVGAGASTTYGAAADSSVINAQNGLSLSVGDNSRLSIASTGAVTIAAPLSAATALVATGIANSNTATFNAPNTTGQSFGITSASGTNSSDYSMRILNATAATEYFKIRGDGVVFIGGQQTMPEIFAVSGSSTTRTSTTTQTCDANLTETVTFPAGKLLHVHAIINWTQGVVNTNGIKIGFAVSGTGAVLNHGLVVGDSVTNANNAAASTNCQGTACGAYTFTDASVVGNSHAILLDGVATAASSGATTICINWAQASSSASATTINSASEMDVQQMN